VCGIVGVVSPGGPPVEPDLFARMCATLAHRGPDDRGTCLFSSDQGPGAALGHTRLSILDLSPSGRQPMANEDGSVHLTCNGEIYNHAELRAQTEGRGHRYRSRTDVETILHLYEDLGLAAPERLNGMFAFGLWDGRRRELLLARDRAGVKPLYYTCSAGRLAFASELKALLPLPWVSREIDPEALDLYLSLLYIPAPWSIFQGIRKLPAGHRLLWREGEVKVEPDFEGRRSKVEGRRSKSFEAEAAEALLERLDRSVGMQLQGDVPAGALLSGGIDSSLIVALMARRAGRIPTFCVGFRGAGHYDERPHARRVAQLFGTEHVEEEVDARLSDLLPALARAFDEPFGDSSAIPTYLVARTAGSRVKAVLSGTGSDELFGGYRRHAAGPVLRAFHCLPAPALRAASALLSLLPGSRTSAFGERVLLARRLMDAACERDGRAYLRLVTFLDEGTKGKVWKVPSEGDGLVGRLFEDRAAGRHTFLDRALAFDRAVYLPDDLLVKEDRMSMAASVEGRVPFLDNDLVDFAVDLPSSLHARGRTTKPLLRRAAAGLLPDDILHRPKHGFGVPISEWLRGDLRGMGLDLLLSPSARLRGLLDADAVAGLWERHAQRRADLGPALWGLIMLELWCQEYAG
jgi:asparagine synthase (glutamine-hydrolysing)